MAKVIIIQMALKPTVIQRREMQRTAQMGIAMHIWPVYREWIYHFNQVVDVISDGGSK